MEGRCVAVIDVPGAFLQADMPEDETVHVRLTGFMVDTLLEINQELYEPFVVQDTGRKREVALP